MLLRCALLLLFSAGIAARAADDALAAELDTAIAKALAHLVAQQGDDGAWHSETYALLKPGVAQTALILETLSRLPAPQRALQQLRIDRALTFLKTNTDPATGGIGTAGEWRQYPTYSTALAILAVKRLQPAGWRETIAPWVAFLKNAQYSEANGCPATHALHGGWNPDGEHREGLPRRADISATRFALQALAAVEVPADDPLWGRAALFLQKIRARVKGAGFTFMPEESDLNKAGDAGYGSATADGVLALAQLADPRLGAEKESLRKQQEWLRAQARTDRNPGIESENARRGWDVGLNFYYRAALAESAAGRSESEGGLFPELWRQLARATLDAQNSSGGWANTSDRMKENDPLLATPLALKTLILCREFFSKESAPVKP